MSKRLFLNYFSELKITRNATRVFQQMNDLIPMNVKLSGNVFVDTLTNEIRGSIDELLSLFARGRSLEALEKIMSPDAYKAFIHSAKNVEEIKNIPSSIYIQESLIKKLENVPVPKTHDAFNTLVKTDQRIRNRTVALLKKTRDPRFLSKVVIGTVLGGSIFALLSHYANQHSGCYLFTVNPQTKKVTKCKDVLRSCGACATGNTKDSCYSVIPPAGGGCGSIRSCCHDCDTEILSDYSQRRCIKLSVIDALETLTNDLIFNTSTFLTTLWPYLVCILIGVLIYGIVRIARLFARK